MKDDFDKELLIFEIRTTNNLFINEGMQSLKGGSVGKFLYRGHKPTARGLQHPEQGCSWTNGWARN